MRALRQLTRIQQASIAGSLIGGLFYFAVLLDLRWSPGRTAVPLGYASNFFDIQARSLLAGRLDVPRSSLGIEGFEIGEQTFMYFPPFPALARVPIFLITDEFDGKLTLLSMATAWIIFAVLATRLVWLISDVLLERREPSRAEAVGSTALIALLTGGTVLTFDASLPWVYHEVYAWAITTVVGALYWLIRVIRDPVGRNIAWLTAFATAAAWTRTTGGLAVIGAIIVAAIWSRSTADNKQGSTENRVHPIGQHHRLAIAAVVPLVASVGLNLVKFNHLYMFPLEHQAWTKYSERRRMALEVNGGTITGPQFLPDNFHAYFGLPGLRLTEHFPWVSLPAEPPPLDGFAFFDQTYRTASVTATSPLLLALVLVAIPSLLGKPSTWRVLVPPLLGSLAVGLPVMMYGYIAYRYTSEFVPALVVGGILGFWSLAPRLLRQSGWIRGLTLTCLVTLTVYSLTLHAILGLTLSAVTQGGDQLQRFVHTQRLVSGGPDSPQSRLITSVAELPPAAAPDTLAILGQCRGLYLGTGDRYEPWARVDAEPVVLEGTLSREIHPGLVKVAEIESSAPRDVLVEVRDDHHVRVIVRTETSTIEGNWFGVYPDTSFRIGIALRSGMGLATVSSTPGGHIAHVPALIRDEHWFTQPGQILVTPGRTNLRIGLSVREVDGTSSSLCRQLLADHQASAEQTG